jgi:hypothetical protein
LDFHPGIVTTLIALALNAAVDMLGQLADPRTATSGVCAAL